MLSRAKIEWRCRRGTRELDLVLHAYLNDEFDRATLSEKSAFMQLLNCQDTELLSHLIGRTSPENSSQARVVSKIRAFVASRA